MYDSETNTNRNRGARTMKHIEMTHQDGSKMAVKREASDVERTIAFARRCGYISFIVN